MIRIVALVPAAGRSERMGRPKLILGLGSESVIQRVVSALERGGADAVLVVAPPVKEPGAIVLANHARAEGAEVVHLDAPTPDMRATVAFGLDAMIEHALAPDAVLLAPGDSPGLNPKLVERVVRRQRNGPDRIVVPVHAGKRGHPIALPWALAQEVHDLPPGVGVNALLERHAGRVFEIAVDDPGAVTDLDTPDDYRRFLGQ